MAIDTIKFKRGVKSKLNNLSYGEPAYISDENELYIGTENGVEKITSNKEVKELSSQLEHVTREIDALVLDVKNPYHGLKPAVGDGITDDSEAIQEMIEYLESNDGGKLFFPSGVYYIKTPLRTKNETLMFTFNKVYGITFEGVGNTTILKGNGKDVIDYDNMTDVEQSSILAIHGTNYKVRNMQFIDSKCGLYIGQDPRDMSNLSRCHKNKFENLHFEDIGTGILYRAGWGSYYNVHNFNTFQNCQIGIHLTPFSGEKYVNNRNTFNSCYFNNLSVGILVENGDSSIINNSNFEGIKGEIFDVPGIIEDGIATAIYTKNSSHPYGIGDWKISNCHAEANDRDIYYDTIGWGFFNCLFNTSKIELTETSNIGAYISNGSSYSNYKWGGYHFGVFHIKQTPDIDPFLPNIEEGTQNTGVYIDKGRISDTGKRRKEVDLLQNPNILDVTDDSKSIYWQLGGVKEWWVKCIFTKADNVQNSQAIRMYLPDLEQPHAIFDKPSVKNGFMFPVQVRTDKGKMETVYAHFLVSGNRIDIPAPSYGWSNDTKKNYICFSLRWF